MTDTSPLIRVRSCSFVDTPVLADRSAISRIAGHAAVVGFLLAVSWLAHFSLSRNIGFYSDDQTFAVPPLAWSAWDAADRAIGLAHSYPDPQGRPLGFLLGYLLPYFGNLAGGVPGMFVVSWLVLSANAILLYYLLRRTVSAPLPILAAVSFLIFPGDTNRPFLCAGHILQPSLTFMLIACHLYLTGGPWRKVIAYVLVAASLITYENAMLPFFVIPLLQRDRGRQWRRRFVIHAGCIVAVIGIVYVTRSMGGEYRATQANGNKWLTGAEILGGLIIGPATCLQALEHRAAQGWLDFIHNRDGARLPIIAGLVMFAAAIGLVVRRAGLVAGANDADDTRSNLIADLRRAFGFGAAVVFVSYLFSFTHFPPALDEGQSTSTHLAAAVGVAVLMATAVGGLLVLRLPGLWDDRRWTGIVVGLSALLATCWLSANIDEQNAYVKLWQQRQQFWTRVLDLCPDLDNGTMIVCDGMLPQTSWYMPALTWSDMLVPRQVYKFPQTFLQPPELQPFPSREEVADGQRRGYHVDPTWYQSVVRNSKGRAVWGELHYAYEHHPGEELPEGKTILLHVDRDGHVTRQGGTVDVAGRPFRLKDAVPRQRPPFPTLPFYSILTGLPASG